MDIVVLDGYTENPGDLSWEGFRALGNMTIYDRTPKEDTQEIIKRIGGAQAVLTNKTPIRSQVIDACPDLKYIGLFSTGTDAVDCEYAAKRGVTVANVPSYSTAAVAQHAIALLLDICSKVAQHNASVHAGEWQDCPDFCYWKGSITELSGLTMGIIGFGEIGRATGRIARAMGMEVLATGSRVRPEGLEIGRYVDLDTLLGQADVISLHCPLKPETRQIINVDTLSKMRPGVIIINTARGGLVDEAALAAALATGRVAAAGVDVVSVEPIRPDNPLLKAPNCVITPHAAWTPRTCRQRVMDIAVSNMRAWIEGRPENVVR